eukprot:366165-Chlamydomonas_euryale.AAC.3
MRRLPPSPPLDDLEQAPGLACGGARCPDPDPKAVAHTPSPLQPAFPRQASFQRCVLFAGRGRRGRGAGARARGACVAGRRAAHALGGWVGGVVGVWGVGCGVWGEGLGKRRAALSGALIGLDLSRRTKLCGQCRIRLMYSGALHSLVGVTLG